jgi:hypothetical protein
MKPRRLHSDTSFSIAFSIMLSFVKTAAKVDYFLATEGTEDAENDGRRINRR